MEGKCMNCPHSSHDHVVIQRVANAHSPPSKSSRKLKKQKKKKHKVKDKHSKAQRERSTRYATWLRKLRPRSTHEPPVTTNDTLPPDKDWENVEEEWDDTFQDAAEAASDDEDWDAQPRVAFAGQTPGKKGPKRNIVRRQGNGEQGWLSVRVDEAASPSPPPTIEIITVADGSGSQRRDSGGSVGMGSIGLGSVGGGSASGGSAVPSGVSTSASLHRQKSSAPFRGRNLQHTAGMSREKGRASRLQVSFNLSAPGAERYRRHNSLLTLSGGAESLPALVRSATQLASQNDISSRAGSTSDVVDDGIPINLTSTDAPAHGLWHNAAAELGVDVTKADYNDLARAADGALGDSRTLSGSSSKIGNPPLPEIGMFGGNEALEAIVDFINRASPKVLDAIDFAIRKRRLTMDGAPAVVDHSQRRSSLSQLPPRVLSDPAHPVRKDARSLTQSTLALDHIAMGYRRSIVSILEAHRALDGLDGESTPAVKPALPPRLIGELQQRFVPPQSPGELHAEVEAGIQEQMLERSLMPDVASVPPEHLESQIKYLKTAYQKLAKQGRTVQTMVTVGFPGEQEHSFVVDRSLTAGAAVPVIAARHGVTEWWHFAFHLVPPVDTSHVGSVDVPVSCLAGKLWLEPDLPLIDQVEGASDAGYKLEMAVVFSHSVAEEILADPLALRYGYHQAKMELLSGWFPCDEPKALNLASLQLQVEYSVRGWTSAQEAEEKIQSIGLKTFLPPHFRNDERPDKDRLAELGSLHTNHCTLSIPEAQIQYMNIVQGLPGFGVYFFTAYEDGPETHRLPFRIGVCRDGLGCYNTVAEDVDDSRLAAFLAPHHFLTHSNIESWRTDRCESVNVKDDDDDHFVTLIGGDGEVHILHRVTIFLKLPEFYPILTRHPQLSVEPKVRKMHAIGEVSCLMDDKEVGVFASLMRRFGDLQGVQPPATHHLSIKLPTGAVKVVQLHEDTTRENVLNELRRRLNLRSGFAFFDICDSVHGSSRWLDPNVPVLSQLVSACAVLYLKVRWWIEDFDNLADGVAIELYYNTLLTSATTKLRLRLNEHVGVQLAALQLQVMAGPDEGDVKGTNKKRRKQIRERLHGLLHDLGEFLPSYLWCDPDLPQNAGRYNVHNRSWWVKNILSERNNELCKLDATAAMKRYILKCTTLPTFGISFFNVKTRDGKAYLLGVHKNKVTGHRASNVSTMWKFRIDSGINYWEANLGSLELYCKNDPDQDVQAIEIFSLDSIQICEMLSFYEKILVANKTAKKQLGVDTWSAIHPSTIAASIATALLTPVEHRDRKRRLDKDALVGHMEVEVLLSPNARIPEKVSMPKACLCEELVGAVLFLRSRLEPLAESKLGLVVVEEDGLMVVPPDQPLIELWVEEQGDPLIMNPDNIPKFPPFAIANVCRDMVVDFVVNVGRPSIVHRASVTVLPGDNVRTFTERAREAVLKLPEVFSTPSTTARLQDLDLTKYVVEETVAAGRKLHKRILDYNARLLTALLEGESERVDQSSSGDEREGCARLDTSDTWGPAVTRIIIRPDD